MAVQLRHGDFDPTGQVGVNGSFPRRVYPLTKWTGPHSVGKPAQPSLFQAQQPVLNGSGTQAVRGECRFLDLPQLGIEFLQFLDLVAEFVSPGFLAIASRCRRDAFNPAQFGFHTLLQVARVLFAKLGQQVAVQLVVVDQAGEGRLLACRELAALDLPSDGTLLELTGVMLEELGGKPLVERFAHQVGEVRLGNSAWLRQPLYSVKQRRVRTADQSTE